MTHPIIGLISNTSSAIRCLERANMVNLNMLIKTQGSQYGRTFTHTFHHQARRC